MPWKPVEPSDLATLITLIQKNEYNIPKSVIDGFLNDFYYKLLQAKVDAFLTK